MGVYDIDWVRRCVVPAEECHRCRKTRGIVAIRRGTYSVWYCADCLLAIYGITLEQPEDHAERHTEYA